MPEISTMMVMIMTVAQLSSPGSTIATFVSALKIASSTSTTVNGLMNAAARRLYSGRAARRQHIAAVAVAGFFRHFFREAISGTFSAVRRFISSVCAAHVRRSAVARLFSASICEAVRVTFFFRFSVMAFFLLFIGQRSAMKADTLHTLFSTVLRVFAGRWFFRAQNLIL